MFADEFDDLRVVTNGRSRAIEKPSPRVMVPTRPRAGSRSGRSTVSASGARPSPPDVLATVCYLISLRTR